MSLTLVPFERVSLVEFAAKYEVSISYGSKVMTKVNVFFSQSLTGQKVDVSKLHSGGGGGGGIKHQKNWVPGQTQREHIVPSYVSFED